MSSSPAQTQFIRQTLVDLATALGLHRNTLSAYRKQGAPAGPPYCELQWRVWLAAHGHTAPTMPVAGLLEQLQRARVTGYEAAAPTAADAPSEPKQADWRERADQAKAQAAEIEARQRVQEFERQQRQLVHVDDARRILLAAAPAITAGFSDLPNVAVEICPDDAQAQARARALIVARINACRQRLATSIEAELNKFLTPQADQQ